MASSFFQRIIPWRRTIGPERVDEYLASRDLARNSKKAYRHAITLFLKHARPGTTGWKERAMSWKEEMTVSPATKALYIIAARGFLGWCVENGHVDANPLDRVKVRVYTFTPKAALDETEARTLLDSLRSMDNEKAVRDRAVITLMLHTGIRIGGLATMDIQDFTEHGERTLLHYAGKGHSGKDSFVVVPPAVRDAVDTYLARSGRKDAGEGALFVTTAPPRRRLSTSAVRKLIKDRLREAGLARPGLSPHSLRHTAAALAYTNGADILSIRDMLGHRSVTTTENYLRSIDRIERAAELVVGRALGGR